MPYYKKVRGKRKKWKTAEKEIMSKFREKKQINILGSREKLMRFKNGEDIEKIFNAIRPKYPIRRYVDVFGYNSAKKEDKEDMDFKIKLAKLNDKIINKVNKINDVKKEFYKLWMNEEKFIEHIETRLILGHITDKNDYIKKTIDCIIEAEEYIYAIHKKSWDNLCYNKTKDWAVIFNEHGEIMTSYKIEKNRKDFETLHKEIGGKILKGQPNEKVKQAFKRLRDLYESVD
ncbi:hypothetical protein [Caminibacter sp.]